MRHFKPRGDAFLFACDTRGNEVVGINSCQLICRVPDVVTDWLRVTLTQLGQRSDCPSTRRVSTTRMHECELRESTNEDEACTTSAAGFSIVLIGVAIRQQLSSPQ